MPSKQIGTPFGYSGYTTAPSYEYFEAQAAGTITALQVVQFSTAVTTGTVVVATSATTEICGIALDSAVSGGILRVCFLGFLPGVTVDSGAGVTAGDRLTAASSGNLVTQAAAAADIGTYVGVALETTSASGGCPIFVKLL